MTKNLKKINELKEQMTKLKENFDNDYQSLEKKLKKLERGSYEVGDIIRYLELDWYVIDFDEDSKKVKLMLKDTLESMTYSDENSNDWLKSNVRNYLNKWASEHLIIGDLEMIKTNYDEDKYSNDLIRIPTLREIEKLHMDVRKSDNYYWTMTASYGVSEDCSNASVFRVGSDGDLYGNSVNSTHGVRPVITLSAETLD